MNFFYSKFFKIFVPVILFAGTLVLLCAESPYTKMFPWVDPKVWDAPFVYGDEFLEQYGIPRKGSTKIDPTVRERRKRFRESFHGIVINGEKFAVVRNNGDFYLESLSGHHAFFGLYIGDSEQESLDFYAGRWEWNSMHSEYYIRLAERIDYGTFCRQIKTPTGAELDFVDGCLLVELSIDDWETLDLLPVAKEINELFRGNAEFLPEDDPEFVQIRENYKKAEAAREREDKEKRLQKLREGRDERVREIIENRELTSILQKERSRQKDEITELENEMKNCVPANDAKNSVPAKFATDSNAWKKLNVRQVKEIFGNANRSFIKNARNRNLLMLDFAAEFWDENGREWKEFRGEIVHAQNLEDAWKFALLLRQKYANFYKIKDWPSKNLEQKFPFPPAKEIAKSTTKNAFPQLGDWNISWIGHRDSSFLVEGESAESFVIFIRGTTVVCICGRKFGESERPYCIDAISVLDFARQMDARLCGDVPAESDNEFDY